MGLKFIFVFFISFLITFLMTPFVRGVGLKVGAIDKPNSRKVHRKIITRIGGLAIYLGFIGAVISVFFIDRGIFDKYIYQLLGVVVGGTIIVVLGLFDDIKGTNAKLKFFWQIVAAVIVICFGVVIRRITNPFGNQIYLGFLLGEIITVVWIVGVTNTLNLIDGLDGLAAGVGGIACVTLFFVGLSYHNWLMAYLALALTGSVVGFLRFNFIPAKVFMGDTGSMFLGFVFACIAVISSQKSAATVALIVPIVALGIPIFDTFFAILRRIIGNVHLFRADQEHIHHKLLKAGFTHKGTVLALYAAGAVFGIFAYLLTFFNSMNIGIMLAVMIVLIFIAVRKLGLLRYSYGEEENYEDEKKEQGEFAFVDSVVRAGKYISLKLKATLIIIPVLVMGLVGWNNSFDKLAQMIDYPEKYYEKEVTLAGWTTGTVSLPFIGSIYRLNDGTGAIWVISKEDYTSNNRFLCVAGKLVKLDLDIKSDFLNDKHIKRLLGDVWLKGPILIEQERGKFTSSLYFLKRKFERKEL